MMVVATEASITKIRAVTNEAENRTWSGLAENASLHLTLQATPCRWLD
jgi:hypothetical protein